MQMLPFYCSLLLPIVHPFNPATYTFPYANNDWAKLVHSVLCPQRFPDSAASAFPIANNLTNDDWVQQVY